MNIHTLLDARVHDETVQRADTQNKLRVADCYIAWLIFGLHDESKPLLNSVWFHAHTCPVHSLLQLSILLE